MSDKKICHVCGKEKKPYAVVMDNNPLSLATYLTAREGGEICERCDQYFIMTSEFKDATKKEFEDVKKAEEFADMMLAWWIKDEPFGNGLNSKDGLRQWEGTLDVSRWAREYFKNKNYIKMGKRIF